MDPHESEWDRPVTPLIDVFVVDTSGELAVFDPRDDPSNDPVLDLRAIGTDAVRQLSEMRATPGQRRGALISGAARDGHSEEVFQPVFVPPNAARPIFLSNAIFDGGMPTCESTRPPAGTTATRSPGKSKSSPDRGDEFATPNSTSTPPHPTTSRFSS